MSSVEVEMKSNFSQGETLIAKISGNFLKPVLDKNIFFYRDYTLVAIIPEVKKFKDEFYVYAQLPENEANYSISIQDVQYMKGNKISEEYIVKNFSISNETTIFSINPGFFETTGDVEIEVQNFQDKKINIELRTSELIESSPKGFWESLFSGKEDLSKYEKSITLISGDKKIIEFTLENITKDELRYIELKSSEQYYNIPLFVKFEEQIWEPVENNSDDDENKSEVPIENNTQSNKENDSTSSIKTCSEMEGIVCEEGYECQGISVTAQDTMCCIGECKEVEKSSWGKTIGWLLVFIAVGFLAWFYKTKQHGKTRRNVGF